MAPADASHACLRGKYHAEAVEFVMVSSVWSSPVSVLVALIVMSDVAAKSPCCTYTATKRPVTPNDAVAVASPPESVVRASFVFCIALLRPWRIFSPFLCGGGPTIPYEQVPVRQIGNRPRREESLVSQYATVVNYEADSH